MLGMSAAQGYALLFILALPVCLWVTWTDLKYMKIPNVAVATLVGVFVIAGLLVFPFEDWAWRWLNAVVVFAIGFALFAFAGWGAGDVKFAAAAAPFFAQTANQIQFAMLMLAVFMIVALVLHRLARAIPAVRRATPDWVSWTSKNFPLGVALAATLAVYLAIRALPLIQQTA